jgi:hypothetical protein
MTSPDYDTMKTFAFIDESGDPVLNEDRYVICAVICYEENLQHDLEKIQEIRAKHCNNAELKSKRTGGKFKNRVAICKSLAALKSKCYVMVINKDRLKRDSGFRIKTSTYKYCQRRLFEKIYKGISQVSVVVDNYGTKEFMESFKPYIDQHFKRSLFSKKEISFSTPLADPLLQVADFVGGTIRRYAQGDDDNSAYLSLEPILGLVEAWPRVSEDPFIDIDSDSVDQAVFRHCMLASEEHLLSENDTVLREALQFLLYSLPNKSEGFIYGDKILDHLKSEGFVEKSKNKHWLRQNVIAKLRRKGVPIAASEKGYKIPSSMKDLEIFVNFVSKKTLPYLDRVNKMRNSLLLDCGGEYDMLNHEPRLKALMESLNRDDI